ncbi:MAG TPA: HEAT repeat domain-containing protein, partial [Syntrophales bacterium]|nr:HEAT repeat domain-containing protein [Syntrophales bacterium]
MKRKALILVLILFIGFPDRDAFSAVNLHLTEWLTLLEKGDSRERQFALSHLWFLGYQENRKDNKVFDPILKALLTDKDPSVRSAAAELLMRIGDSSKGCCKETNIVPSLIKALEDKSSSVRGEAALALGYYKDKRAVDPLIKTLQDEDPWVRLNAVSSLGIGIPKAFSITPYVPLGSAEQTIGMDSSGRFWYPALEYGWEGRKLEIEKVVQPLLDLLTHDIPDWRHKFVQQEAVIALRKIRPAAHRKSISVLIQKSGDDYLRGEIIKSLGSLRAKEAKDIIEKATKDTDERIRRLAVASLSRLSTPVYRQQDQSKEQKTEIFIKMIKDPSAEVRRETVEKLGQTGDVAAVDPLIDALRDGDREVRQKAVEALEKFKEERVLDAMLPFFSRDGYYGYTQNPAEKTFLSVAEKTREREVYVYRKEGVRYVVNRPEDVPKGVSRDLRIVHSMAVSKLLDQIDHSDEQAKVSILNVLGRIEDDRIEPCLIRLIEDPSAPVRHRAVSLLGSVGSPAAVPHLIAALRSKDSGMRESTASALETFRDRRALEPLIAALKDSQASVRSASLRSLGKFDDSRVLYLNRELLKDESLDVRRVALGNVLDKRDQKAVELVIPFLNDQDWFVASLAAKTLGEIGDPRGVDPLIRALKGESNKKRRFNGDMDLRRNAAEALGKIGGKKAVRALIEELDTPDINLKMSIIKSLGRARDNEAVPFLINLLSEGNLSVCYNVILALGEIGDPYALDTMKALLGDKRFNSYRGNIIESIGRIKDDRAAGVLVGLLNSQDSGIVNPTISALGKFNDGRIIKPMIKITSKDKTYVSYVLHTFRGSKAAANVDILISALEDQDPDVRLGAILLLGSLGDAKAVEPLRKLLDDPDPEFRTHAKNAINEIEAPEKQKKLGFSAKMDLPQKPIVVGGTISPQVVVIPPEPEQKEKEFGDSPIPPKVVDLNPMIVRLKSGDPKIRQEAADVLGDSGNLKAVDPLIPSLKDKDEYVRQAAARALGKLKDRKAVEPLIDNLKDPDIKVRAFALWSLGEIQDPGAVEPVALQLLSDEEKIREFSFEAMRKFEGPAARKVLINTLIKSRWSWMLDRLISLEGEDVVLKAFEDPGGDHVKTVRNYIALLATGGHAASGIVSKALKNDKDRDLVISEISKQIKTGQESVYIYVSFLGDLGDPKGLPILREVLNNR